MSKQMANHYARAALKWPHRQPPPMLRKTVGMMGMKGIPGLYGRPLLLCVCLSADLSFLQACRLRFARIDIHRSLDSRRTVDLALQ